MEEHRQQKRDRPRTEFLLFARFSSGETRMIIPSGRERGWEGNIGINYDIHDRVIVDEDTFQSSNLFGRGRIRCASSIKTPGIPSRTSFHEKRKASK